MGRGIGIKKTAVVLLNLGGPSCLEEVKPFLFSLFSDPAILTLPNPFRFILANLITKRRLKEARHIYSLLGGKSPLLPNTQAQADALKEELGPDHAVFVAMRHAPPLSPETVEKVKAYDPDEVVLLPLYPQYSKTTTESSFRAWEKAAKGWMVPTRFIVAYGAEKGFLEALVERARSSYQEAEKHGLPKLLLTAHGLPEKFIRKGDPYQQQVEQTARALLETLGLSVVDSTLCYQSRVGPLKWIGPYTEDEIRKASRERRPLVVVPLSFVSEHSETLVELDITYRDLALAEGCPAYYRADTVQTHPAFIKGLAGLVRNHP
jgi:ferrochelatase